jgi:cytoskeletal protein RodZ
MKSFGQILIDARNRKGLSLEDAEAATKIRKKILESLEKGDWGALPAPTFLKGLIKNYAQFLEIDPNELLAFYRREYIEKKEHRAPTVPVEKSRLRITPQLVTVTIVCWILRFCGGNLFVCAVPQFYRRTAFGTGSSGR